MKPYLPIVRFCIVVFSSLLLKANAQSTTITPGNNQPSLTATSTNNGIIVPQITLTANLASASPVTNPPEGLIIYNSGNNQSKGLYYWTGSAWRLLSTVTTPISIVSNNLRLNPGTAAGQLITWNGNNWVNTNPKPPANVTNLQPYLAINYCISLFGIFPSQNDSQPYIGELAQFGFNFTPNGWASCNGQLLSISENETLFVLIGTTYGGDGQSTYGLPDLRGRVPIHQGQGPGLGTNYIIGQMGGTETRTIDNKY